MAKVIDYVKQYIGVISIVLAVCILLTYSLSYFIVNGGTHRAAEMYIGELKYAIAIEGNSTNTLSVPSGETIVDINITNQNEIKTYFKLLYLKNSNVTISYYNETKNTSEVYTKYLSSGDLLEKGITGTLKLKIINNSSSTQTLTFSVSGGYSTNKLTDVEIPNTYSEITTLETPDANTYFCKISSTLSVGLEYVNGQYTYRYMQKGGYSKTGLSWTNISEDGWGVQLTDKTSTDAVTSKLCTYINNKPVVSMSYMFDNSKATTLDLSNFNTSKVTNMSSMFSRSQVTTLDLSNFDTSKVINMYEMFYNSQATTLDLSNFDTRNVTDMSWMFSDSQATTLDLSNFNTSKVTNMSSMFSSTKATTIDVSNFNTSKVTNMSFMFSESQATTLDVSNFNTSNVTNMNAMFQLIQATTLDVSNFNTSNVTNMSYMFSNSNATTLDVSNFNTSKVIDMSSMFYNAKATALDVSNFNTSKVTNMSDMFSNSAATSITGLSNFDTSNVTNMSYMFRASQATTIDVSNFNTSNVTNMSWMFYNTKAKTIYSSDKFVTNSVTSSNNMFGNATNLVGGNGTAYNSSYVDKTYARIDTASTPGYFTNGSGFEIPEVTVTYSYGESSPAETTISIKNIGKKALQIKSVSIDGDSVLKVVGDSQPIVNAKETNTDFKLAITNTAIYGVGSVYYGNVIVTDIDGKTYKGVVYVTVEAAKVPVTPVGPTTPL